MLSLSVGDLGGLYEVPNSNLVVIIVHTQTMYSGNKAKH